MRRTLLARVSLMTMTSVPARTTVVMALSSKPPLGHGIRTRNEFVTACTAFAVALVSDADRAVSASSTWLAAASSPPQSTATLVPLRASLEEARDQLNSVPKLIHEEKWDSVRAVLLQPPLSDCWSKAANAQLALVPAYASAVGDAGGEELQALELREAVASHLRYLDMAVYSNVFNPITSQGTTGASAELVRSYYEDPTNEYKDALAALQDLIALSDGLL